MAMSKAQLRQWPWNNRPSARHVWRCDGQHVDVCDRCGSRYYRPGGGSGAVYCYPTPDWLRDHPEDDRKQG
jgi:squalene cyclase